ncbi:hypothetical protein [Mycobacterium syngnathidarum]
MTDHDEPSSLDGLGEYVPHADDHADDEVSALDVLGKYVGVDTADGDIDDFAELPSPMPTEDEEPDSLPLFSATNPPGTVTVTVYMNGSVQHVNLSPAVTKMTESQLSQEIRNFTGVATEKARAGQYVYFLYTAVQHAGDSPMIRNLLAETLGLPTPEQAAETEAAFLRNYGRAQH